MVIDPEIKLLNKEVASAFFGNFKYLTTIQVKTIPLLIAGKNVVITSGTGSGKTEAALAPILSSLWGKIQIINKPLILYIAPTKALVNDLEKRLSNALGALRLNVGIRHGDRDDLNSKILPNILITTPESLDVMLFRKDDALSEIKAVLLDEVHLLYNSQRGLQLSILLNRLKTFIGKEFQWVALSATINKSSDIKDFLFGKNETAEYIDVASERKIDAFIKKIENGFEFSKFIEKLVDRPQTKLLIFANSRNECENLAGILNQNEKIKNLVFTHYSSLSTEIRLETERNFAKFESAVCIATSTLELGIDIGDINAVILWDIPNNVESFLQRIGRGNRRSNKTNVICLISYDSTSPTIDILNYLTLIYCARNAQLPKRNPYELFGSIVQQILSYIGSNKGGFVKISELQNLVSFYENLSRPQIELITAELSLKDYLTKHGFKNKYGGNDLLYELIDYKMIYGNFPLSSRTIDIKNHSKLLGSIPAVNLLKLKRGSIFQFAGKRWVVLKITNEGIIVEHAKSNSQPVKITYPGKGLGMESFLIDKLWNLIHSNKIEYEILSKNERSNLEYRIKEFGRFVKNNEIPCLKTISGWRYFTFAGYLVNFAICAFAKINTSDINDFFVEVNSEIDFSALSSNVSDYVPYLEDLIELGEEQTFFQTLLPKDLQFREFLQNWVNDNSIEAILKRLINSKIKVINNDIIKLIID